MFEPAVNKLRAAVQLQLKAYKQLQAHNPMLGQVSWPTALLVHPCCCCLRRDTSANMSDHTTM
jgi:hypothetical protein